jgi:hypothetical protein
VGAVRALAKRILPERIIDSYRRRRVLRLFLRSLGYELYDRQEKIEVEEIEGKVLARRPDLTERLMSDLLKRTDLVLQQLHREIEGVEARHGADLRALRDEVAALRSELEGLGADRAERAERAVGSAAD